MKIVTIVGARPQFIKMTPVSHVLRRQFEEVIVHTGQHYDFRMSQVFFGELGIPAPDYNLAVGSGPQGQQTGDMLARTEQVLDKERPDWVLVFGDTNSTLAGALAAAKLQIPVAHVEAGLRSFNRAMPEEINRVLTDHVARLLFCPTETAVAHLNREGIQEGVHLVGDVMYDAVLEFGSVAQDRSKILVELELSSAHYLLATVHRPYNTDNYVCLAAILDALASLSETIVFPIHPRTRTALAHWQLQVASNIRLIEPVSYLDMLALEKNARVILTDSGGVQKEAYFFKIPCVTMRSETEWIETVDTGWNKLVGTDGTKILKAVESFTVPTEHPLLFGDGHASDRILEIIKQHQVDSLHLTDKNR